MIVGDLEDLELVAGQDEVQVALLLIILAVNVLADGDRAFFDELFEGLEEPQVVLPLDVLRLEVALGLRQVGAEQVDQGVTLLDLLAERGVDLLDQGVESRADLRQRVGVIGGASGQFQLDRLGLRLDGDHAEADGLGLLLVDRDGAVKGPFRLVVREPGGRDRFLWLFGRGMQRVDGVEDSRLRDAAEVERPSGAGDHEGRDGQFPEHGSRSPNTGPARAVVTGAGNGFSGYPRATSSPLLAGGATRR